MQDGWKHDLIKAKYNIEIARNQAYCDTKLFSYKDLMPSKRDPLLLPTDKNSKRRKVIEYTSEWEEVLRLP